MFVTISKVSHSGSADLPTAARRFVTILKVSHSDSDPIAAARAVALIFSARR